MSYCKAIESMPEHRRDLHKAYHDFQYGFPIHSDNELFGRLILEINQAGLSWETVLKKQDSFRDSYSNFNIQKVANYTDNDRARLLSNPNIIRNRLKVNAAIENARSICALQEQHGSFEGWLNHHYRLSRDEWVKLFKNHFVFTGGEIVNEFLMSTGHLEGAHDPDCYIYSRILKQEPMWLKK